MLNISPWLVGIVQDPVQIAVFAFNIFSNFLKKLDLNSYMNSFPLEMLIYQNYAFFYSELSVVFFPPALLTFSPLQLGRIRACEEGRSKASWAGEMTYCDAEQPPQFCVNKGACVNITRLHFFLHLTEF